VTADTPADSGLSPSFRSLFKSIVRGSGLYSLALFAHRMMGVLLLPINTRFLMPADYGVLELVEQISTLLATLLGVNFAAALGYFYVERDEAEARRRVRGTALIGSVLIGVVGALAGWLAAPWLSGVVFRDTGFTPYLRFVLLAMPLSFLLEAGLSILRVEDRPAEYVAAALLRVLLTIAGTILLVAVLRWRIWGVLTTSVVAIGVVALALLAYHARSRRLRFERALFGRMARFSIPISLTGVAQLIIQFGDRFVLSRRRTLAEVGIYALAAKLAITLGFIQNSFHTYWNAQVFQIARRDDAETVLGRVFTYFILTLSFCGLGLAVFSRPAFRILTTPAFHGAAAVVPLLVGAFWLRAIGDYFRCLFLVAGRPGYDALCNWMGVAVCLGGYVMLIPRFGIWGAAAATAITFLVTGAAVVLWTRRLRRIRLERERLAKIGLVLAALMAGYYLVPFSALAAQIGWAAVLLAAYPLLLWVLRLPTAGERDSVRAALAALLRSRGAVLAGWFGNRAQR
jgi:O-antigen/teichoic acid export membrane protein